MNNQSENIISVSGNNNFLLSKKADFFEVIEGKIDVFVVKKNKDGSSGKRIFMYSAKIGELILPYNPDLDEKYDVYASGTPGSGMIRLELKNIEKDRINKAILKISKSICKEITPKKIIIIDDKDEIKVENENVIMPKDDISWISVKSGKMNILSMKEINISEGDIIPITDDFFARASEDCMISHLLIDDINMIVQRLADFTKIIVSIIFVYQSQKEEEERKRLEQKHKNDENYFKRSVVKLGGIINKSLLDEVTFSQYPLINIFKLVAKNIGIDNVGISEKLFKESAPNVDSIARITGLRVRKVILKGEWWKEDNGALIAFKTSKEPIALIPATPSKYKLISNGQDSKFISEIDSEDIAPVAYTLYRPLPSRRLSAFDLLSYGIKSTWKRDFIVIFIMGMFMGILQMVLPFATGLVFDNIIPLANRSQLFQLTIALIVCTLATFLFKVVQALALIRAEGKMDASLQAAVWDRLLELPARFFKKYSSGDLSNRAMCISYIRAQLSGSALFTIFSGLFSLFNLLLLFYYNKFLAMIAMGIVGFAVIVTSVSSYYRIRYTRLLARLEGKMEALVLQLIGGVTKFRVAGAENRAFFLWSRLFSEKKEIEFKANSVNSVLSVFDSNYPIIASMIIFAMVLYSYKKALLLSQVTGITPKMLSTGKFIGFNAAFSIFLLSMLQLFSTMISILEVIPLYERAKPILDAMPETGEAKAHPGELNGNLDISGLTFSYDKENGRRILDDVSFTVNTGEFVAIVGPSGCGKSTLLRLLLGFETPDSGTIFYDGQDLSSVDIKAVRHQLGVVLQNGKIMAGDIFSNIVGSNDLTPDDAMNAARMAGFDKDIDRMPMGLHTVVSEGGGTLSGGQRQRMLISRAIVNKPRILYFDEATSALDNKTQEIVSENIERLKSTRIVIAHRLSTIINADKIIVLDAGKIIEMGNYESLMQKKGTFYELARRQIA